MELTRNHRKCSGMCVVTFVLLVLSSSACSKSYVPTSSQIHAVLGDQLSADLGLVPGDVELKGLWGNFDVDSLLFEYQIQADLADEQVVGIISQRLLAQGWRKMSHSEDLISAFDRVTQEPNWVEQSVEAIWLSRASDRNLCVAWAQIDVSLDDAVDGFEGACKQNHGEAAWIKENLLPRLESQGQK